MDQRHLPETMNAWTGQNERFLLSLRKRLKKAESVDLIISFIRESGVDLLIEQLSDVPHLRILTGTYLNITEPWALRRLKEELPHAEIRLFDEPGVSFHPKAWIFHYPDALEDEVIVGSSNLSRSALTYGVEWNGALHAHDVPHFLERFDVLFSQAALLDEDRLEAYSASWTRPPITSSSLSDPSSSAGISDPEGSPALSGAVYEPRNVQIEALYALDQARANGVKKAMVQAATGVGKTFLAAFDARGRRRILFVAHRQEILSQAMNTFAKVHPNQTLGLLTGEIKQPDADIVFASVMTLMQEEWLSYYEPDAFDYIVIDEFHHATSDSYRGIIDHFQPDFLLGLTATPERMDGRDVYALCDYNIPYSITLQDAINKGILCPFHYYGIYDATDYSNLKLHNGRYSTADLDRLYHQAKERIDLILGHFRKHHPKKALGFCASRHHAEQMKEAFNKAGIPSAAIYSGSKDERTKALEDLSSGQIQVVFSVDMLNEGVDIPEVDAVMMLRPTESPTVFLQQLGRGLRKAESKPFLTVLDFIGNYRNASRIPAFLEGGRVMNVSPATVVPPLDCMIDFDLELIDLFEKMQRNAASRQFEPRFKDEFDRIQRMKGHRPSRMDLFEELDEEILAAAMKRGKKNPLHHYLAWLHDNKMLDEQEEEHLWNSPARSLIELLESTQLTQLYKVPVLYAFLDGQRLRRNVSEADLLRSWKAFFGRDENWKDFIGLKAYGNVRTFRDFQKISDKKHAGIIKNNPVKFLIRSSNGLLQAGDGCLLHLEASLSQQMESLLVDEWRDILDFRTIEYRRSRFEKRQNRNQNPTD